jgi:two-component system phosphate regulon response regulator PhoB
MKHILLAENDTSLSQTLYSLLHKRGFAVSCVSDLASAYEVLDRKACDLLIVDRMLDDGDGLDLISYLKEVSSYSHLLCLSQLSSAQEKIKGLAKGADDYLAKPFDTEELLLRVDRLMGKQKLKNEAELVVGEVHLFPETGVLITPSITSQLRRREAQLLSCLFRYQNRTLSRDNLIEMVWKGTSEIPTYTTLDVYIRRIRIALGASKHVIKTMRGFGYKASA